MPKVSHLTIVSDRPTRDNLNADLNTELHTYNQTHPRPRAARKPPTKVRIELPLADDVRAMRDLMLLRKAIDDLVEGYKSHRSTPKTRARLVPAMKNELSRVSRFINQDVGD